MFEDFWSAIALKNLISFWKGIKIQIISDHFLALKDVTQGSIFRKTFDTAVNNQQNI